MKVFISLLLLSVFSGYAFTQSVTPLEYKDSLVTIYNDLVDLSDAWTDEFLQASKKQGLPGLIPYRERFEKYVDAAIINVNKMADLKGSEDFRKTLMDFLYFEKKRITTCLYKIEKCNSSTPIQEINEVGDYYDKLNVEKDILIEKIDVASQAYAAKNGF